ncbi:MAG: DinB family protein [Pyrinomonadaceae bacterium]
MNRPDKTEYAPYYERYVSLVTPTDVMSMLGEQTTQLQDILNGMPEEKGEFRYAEGKWSIKELLGHVIDGERMFAYRVLRISRGDATPIEGFEQDGYIENANSNHRSLADLLEEFSLLRRANMIFFKNLDGDGWSRIGTASGATVSVRALGYIMAGHVEHHLGILKERYLA